jgi:hypothetical protein
MAVVFICKTKAFFNNDFHGLIPPKNQGMPTIFKIFKIHKGSFPEVPTKQPGPNV